MISSMDFLREMNIYSLIVRLLLAIFIPSTLGLERERAHHNSSLSTYALVTLGSALTMILSQYESALFAGPWRELSEFIGIKTDVSRFGAQVINGIGFLGAGTIIVTGRKNVKGLTTAAGLWSSACLGLAIGVGFYECVLIGYAIMFITMHFLPPIQEAIISRSKYFHLFIEISDVRAITDIVDTLKKVHANILDIEIQKSPLSSGDEARYPCVDIFMIIPNNEHRINLISAISGINHVLTIEEI